MEKIKNFFRMNGLKRGAGIVAASIGEVMVELDQGLKLHEGLPWWDDTATLLLRLGAVLGAAGLGHAWVKARRSGAETMQGQTPDPE